VNFTLIWTAAADDELIDLWLQSDSALRAQISESVRNLESLLLAHADTAGESRGSNRRIIFVGPMHFMCQVFEQTKLVKVLGVGMRPRPKT
jgi:hypothetical protein